MGIQWSRDATLEGTIDDHERHLRKARRSRTWKISGTLVLAAAAIYAILQYALPGAGRSTTTERVSFAIEDTKAFKALPRPVPLPPGQADPSTLKDLYLKANNALADRLKAVSTAPAGIQHPQGFTLISGIAGVGKSFIVRHLSDLLGAERPRTIDLRHGLYKDPAVAAHVSEVGQLAIDMQSDKWFNRMPGLVDANRKPMGYSQLDTLLRPLLSAPAGTRVTILDSDDEIHPQDATFVLELVESISKASPSLHFVILGRPESLRPFLTDSNGGRDRQRAHYPLHAPSYATIAEIETFVRDQESHKGSPLGPVVRANLIREFSTSAAIRPCLKSLALTNFCYESVQRRLESGTAYDDAAFKEEIFQNMLERNGRSHGRPTKAAPATLALYRAALERIAVEYRDRVNDAGFFGVGYTDTVAVMDGDTPRVFNVAEVLDFSGLVELDPVEAQSRHYRFVPVWLHAHLLNSYLSSSNN